MRACAAAAKCPGRGALGGLYVSLGNEIHGQSSLDKWLGDKNLISEALAEAGLPSELVSASLSLDYDAGVRESHRRGQSVVGITSGTPIVAVDGVGVHGPVISSVPKGEAAGQLFDGSVTVASK